MIGFGTPLNAQNDKGPTALRCWYSRQGLWLMNDQGCDASLAEAFLAPDLLSLTRHSDTLTLCLTVRQSVRVSGEGKVA